ncbi:MULTISPECIES: ACP S-malonyltransferase [Brevibacterium]|uniref:[acyl-carrier-protein] S-malonyltransferase n=1 Tax=Brevibacterium salitolerans TaxID=1403566 RepID=A0ABN2X6J2_9MICO|nr:ACP S-malonyltransferase [Brevibacterium sp.]
MLVTACPGQGAQKAGFLSSWLELPGFASALGELAEASGIDLVTHGTVSDDATITDTALAQPLLVAAAIASYREIFIEAGLATDLVAGHSVGEIGAAQIAGILSPTDAMALVQVRGAAMAAAAAAEPSGMAAVVGGDPEQVLAAIAEAGLEPANVNGGGQTVAAGSKDAIAAFAENPPERARVIPLKVAGAFHTSYMGSATQAVSEAAASITPADPSLPILTNSDGTRVESGQAYLDLLVSQVTSPVRWDLCQATLLEAGVTGILELVPGGTLTGLAKRAMKGVEVFAVKSAADVEGAREFVRAHTSA